MTQILDLSAREHSSRVLSTWLAGRDGGAERAGIAAAATPISEITRGSEMYEVLTGGYAASSAGVPVTDRTAMASSAVYAAVALLGGAIGAVPYNLFKRQGGSRSSYDSDLWWMFNEQPWHTWTAASAWSWAGQSIGLRGDSFWRIRRVTPYTNQIEGFEPLHPSTSVRREKGRNVYTHAEEDGRLSTVDQDDILHFPGVGFDGLRSMTPIHHALRPAVGVALAADEFAGSFFRNGARPDFALSTDKSLKKEDRDTLRETWATRHQGASAAHLPAVLTGGLKLEQLSLNAEDSQLLATRKFGIEEVARIFGVPPHMIGYTEKTSSWGAGVEQMSIGFVRYTLRRHLNAIQQEINRKVWPKSRIYFGEFNTDALLEGDSKAQAEFWSKALGGPGAQGWMTVNEVRRLKNLPPVRGGNDMVYAGRSTAAPTPAPAPKEDPEPADPALNPDEEIDDASAAQAAGQ